MTSSCQKLNPAFESASFGSFLEWDAALSDDQRRRCYARTVPFIINLVLHMPDVFTSPVALLERGKRGSVKLTGRQCASVLAAAFFCVWPWRNKKGGGEGGVYANYPSINFADLHAHGTVDKFHCIMHYFDRLARNVRLRRARHPLSRARPV